MTQNHFILEGISKSFGVNKVLDNLSLEFTNGGYSIQGQNGIGKSTLLSIMAGALLADAGNIVLNNYSFKRNEIEAKKLLSYVPDKLMAYSFMTGKEWMTFISRVKKCQITETIHSLIKDFGLKHLLNERLADLSLGTQKKFMLAAAMIGDPKLIIFDEPSNGLDVVSCQLFTQYLKAIQEQSIVIISTHDETFLNNLTPNILRLSGSPLIIVN